MPQNTPAAAPKRLLTIQDVSCVGQCSATVALPLVSAGGVECAVLPSAVLSNHTGGFPSWTFRDLTDEMPRVEAEWVKQGIRFDAFYTGYVCGPQIDPILSIMDSCAAPGALRIVDPAMADNGKLYAGFGPDFTAQMARLCKGADFVLPNLTEAAFLLGREPVLDGYDRAFVEDTVAGLHALGAKNVVRLVRPGAARHRGVGRLDGPLRLQPAARAHGARHGRRLRVRLRRRRAARARRAGSRRPRRGRRVRRDRSHARLALVRRLVRARDPARRRTPPLARGRVRTRRRARGWQTGGFVRESRAVSATTRKDTPP